MIPEVLAWGFMQRAYVAGLLSASALSVVGVFIVLKRMSNIGEGLSNVAFAGLAIGILFGAAPLPLALAATILAVFLIQRMSAGVYGEVAVQIMCSGGFALGVVIVSSSRGFNVNLLGYLFGSLLSVTEYEIGFIAALAALTFAAVSIMWRQLTYAAFSEESARSAGLPVDRINLALMLLTAASVVAGMRVVGILLVSSMLVVPAACAIIIARNFKQTMFLSIAFSAASVIVGLTAAYYLDVAAGGAVVLAQVAIFFAVYISRR
jgi:zinc transport system permease protein